MLQSELPADDTASITRLVAPDDAERVTAWVTRAAAGNQQAWTALVKRFNGMILTVARNHGLSPANAAEVSQTTWLRLVEHLGRIEHPERIGAWLTTTARHESLRMVRSAEHRFIVQITDDDRLSDLIDIEALPLDAKLVTDERDSAVRAAFARLPTRCRAMLFLLMSEPAVSYKELADALEIPVGSIGPTRARCLATLRRIMIELEDSSPEVSKPADAGGRAERDAARRPGPTHP
jgi:RNA polymerase sigma factor (sigma-70 family)